LLPTLIAAYLFSIEAGVDESKASTLIVLATVLDIAAFLETRQAYIVANGRRPRFYPKVLELWTRWSDFVFWGVGMRALLLWQFFRGSPLQVLSNNPFAAALGFIFVPTTACASTILSVGDMSLLVRGIVLMVAGMLDLSFYSAVHDSWFDRRERMLDFEWERGLPMRDSS
jgi:hypothetical protein